MSNPTQSRYETVLEGIRSNLREASTLAMMVMAVWWGIRQLGVVLLEEELQRRAREPEVWPTCPHCGRNLCSKGFRERCMLTLVGEVTWVRRIGRCPNGCKDAQTAPLDTRLGIKPGQRTSDEIKRLGCMLSIFVPFATATTLLQQMTGIALSPDSLWTWCQEVGQQIHRHMEAEQQAMAEGKAPAIEVLPDHLQDAPLAIGADGVMVPLRPQTGTPAGKTQWREVKVGIFTRLTERLTRKGEPVAQLEQRRVVAMMGSVDEFMPALQLEAEKQGIAKAKKIIWLSDGGKGFWRIFDTWLQTAAANVRGILDFYHAAQNLSHAAKAWLDGRSTKCREWFSAMRHKLRHGQEQTVLNEMKNVLDSGQVSGEAKQIFSNTYEYLKRHETHINYQDFKTGNLPIGSGLVESACKWLIQQRFKGVGMRWSEDGLNALLHLRVAWVNQRFDTFFPLVDPSPS